MDRLMQHIDAYREEAISLLRDLVGIDSTFIDQGKYGNEKDAQLYLEKKLNAWGLSLIHICFENVRALYPQGIHGAICAFMEREPDLEVRTATPQDEGFGLSQSLLDDTAVLI